MSTAERDNCVTTEQSFGEIRSLFKRRAKKLVRRLLSLARLASVFSNPSRPMQFDKRYTQRPII
jgi:hypothetical protein